MTKYFLIKYMNPAGHQLTLQKNGRVFLYNDYARNKQYKTLAAARKKAKEIRNTHQFRNDPGDLIVVEVAFEPCNPLLSDGFYKPVHTVVSSF